METEDPNKVFMTLQSIFMLKIPLLLISVELPDPTIMFKKLSNQKQEKLRKLDSLKNIPSNIVSQATYDYFASERQLWFHYIMTSWSERSPCKWKVGS